MKSEKLLKAIGDIEDRFIEEADASSQNVVRVRKKRRRNFGIAASFAVVVLAGVIALVSGSHTDDRKAVNTAGSAIDRNGTEYAMNTAMPPDSNEDRSMNAAAANELQPATPDSANQETEKHSTAGVETSGMAQYGNTEVPEDFRFSLVWNTMGESFYDSSTGKLVKTNNATHPEDYVTVYEMTDKEKRRVFEMIKDIDIMSYPDDYNPMKYKSKPSRNIILTVSYGDISKTITCNGIGLGDETVDEKGEKFMALHDLIVQILTQSNAWKKLPDYEFLYS